ncbi:NADH dehydrogenase (ubiquinone) complex I, assembly factor 6 [Seminavis robusta]|uniref:NADH dehydrogenase (Ubiquinone) complex I, assembly factor 6 n=1 Tax=Seminavis robusta TaxID=568900 RepID=A0A9N8HG29_9STRA|nr:NADH dehydrogenase (ubiquinone) complex I, assembly factor 6 [Seminavis robusta]|eukprot:Sro487_g152960.1 NADH dehydrogenase (ubiquinone) complex I, assembly factor 6 (1295) ;mRNA; f:57171-61055
MAQDEERYFWMWYGDHGASWTPFDWDGTAQLEEARKAGTPKVLIRGTFYQVDVMAMEQVNLQSGFSRPVMKVEARWYWLDDDGRSWHCYKQEDALKLALGQLAVEELGPHCGVHVVQLQFGHVIYEVDLVRRKQRNAATGTERDVHQGCPRSLRQLHRSLVVDDISAAAIQQQLIQENSSHSHNSSSCRNNNNNNNLSTSFRKNPSLRENGLRQVVEEVANASQQTGGNVMMDTTSTITSINQQEGHAPSESLCSCLTRLLLGQNTDDDGEENDTDPSQQSAKNNNKQSSLISNGSSHVQESPLSTPPPPPQPQAVTTTTSPQNFNSPQQAPPPPAASPPPTPEEAPPPSRGFTEEYARSKDIQDTVKVVCLGLNNTHKSYRNPTNAQGEMGVHQYSWGLKSTDDEEKAVFCSVFDFVGQNIHHGISKLYFTPRSVYVIVWDLGASNPFTFPRNNHHSFGLEPAKVALERDIFEHVQFLVDGIHKHAPDAVILPVASLDGSFRTAPTKQESTTTTTHNTTTTSMDETEIHRRCLFLKQYFQEEQRKTQYGDIIFGPDEDPLLLLGGAQKARSKKAPHEERLDGLKRKLIELSSDSDLFPDLGENISSRFHQVRTAVKRLSQDGTNVVQVDQLYHGKGPGIEMEVFKALQWLSKTGEILYYDTNEQLQGFAILNLKWPLKVINSLMGPSRDLRTTVELARRNTPDGPQNTDPLHFGPVASMDDIAMLWRKVIQVECDNSETDVLSDYMRVLLTYVSVMVPLEISNNNPPNRKIFFIPGFLGSGDYKEYVHFYRNVTFSGITLSQSVHFHTPVSSLVLERIWASILGHVYSNAKLGRETDRTEGRLYLKDITCYRDLFHFKFRFYTRTSNEDIQPSDVEVYIHFMDASSPEELCVGANFMGELKQKMIISAKGEGGNGGRVIWKGGYECVSDATHRFLGDTISELDLERHFFCPSCLKGDLRQARAWNASIIEDMIESGEEELICGSGHRERTHLLLGISTKKTEDVAGFRLPSSLPPSARASALMPGVVMVGLYDPKRSSERIRKVGSGFIVDKRRGLIVTAAHTLMKLDDRRDFGRDFDGIEGAKAVIGVIPKRSSAGSYPPAIFRYFAKIYRKDPSLAKLECHVDACVLQITARFENDVSGNGDLCNEESLHDLEGDLSLMRKEPLEELKVVQEAHIGEPVRIFGFDQPDSSRLNRSIEISPGQIQKQVSTEAFEGERYQYTPRKKILCKCPTIVGHSGGPCVNQRGEVIGILSCADFTEKSLCYLAPTSEWIHLLNAVPGNKTLHLQRAVTN